MQKHSELMNGNSSYMLAFAGAPRTFKSVEEAIQYYTTFLETNKGNEIAEKPMTLYIITPIHCFNPGSGETNGAPPTDGGTPVMMRLAA